MKAPGGHHHGDPIAAIRGELVSAARRRTLARRRRRRGLLVAALAGALLMLTGAAIAVTRVSTGVPAIDELLDRASQPPPAASEPEPHPGDARPLRGIAPPVPQFKPSGAESVSPPLQITLPDGTAATAVGYRTADGSICTAIAQTGDAAAQVGGAGGVGCLGGRAFQRELKRSPGKAIGAGVSSAGLTVSGFARADVEAITARTSGQRARAQVSPAWNPEPGTTIKLFYVFFPQAPPKSDRRQPHVRLEARVDDGSTVPFEP